MLVMPADGRSGKKSNHQRQGRYAKIFVHSQNASVTGWESGVKIIKDIDPAMFGLT